MRWLRCVGVALIGAAWVTAAHAAPETSSHPIGVYFDDEPRPTTAYLRFTAERYDLAVADYARRDTDPAAQAFVALIDALRRKDVDAARPLLDPRGLGEATPAWLVGFLAEGWGGLRAVQVLARMPWKAGGEAAEVFVFRVPSADGPWVRSLVFRRYMGRWQGRLVTATDPVLALINDTLTHAARAPSAFRALPVSGARYGVPLDPSGAVTFEFAGQMSRFDPVDGAASTEATALFQQGMRLLAAGEWDAYAALHTPMSAAKIRQGVARQAPEVRAKSGPLFSQFVEVLFEMDLGPAGAIVWYGQGNLPDLAERSVKAAFVARTPQGLRLTNFLREYQLSQTLTLAEGWPTDVGGFVAVIDRADRSK